jgi:hypothetical protein
MPEILASRYFLDDLPGASQQGARLNGILKKIDDGTPLSGLSLGFLATNKLDALCLFVAGDIGWEAFQQKAEQERADRSALAEKRAAEAEEALAAQAIQRAAELKEFFAAQARDPKLKRQREVRELKRRFGIGFVDTEHYPRVMSLLRRVSNGDRLSADDIVWLQTEAEDCWTEELQRAWHTIEAEALTREWERSRNPWDAINASSHWRKAAKPSSALELTEQALAKAGTDAKARSALLTTRGGAFRDLRNLDEAKAQGLAAHGLTPRDFRPCTLLGAVHIELGDLVAGREWYLKAEKLGADRRAIDQDLRALLARTSKSERQRITEFLIAQDPERFGWLLRK